MQASVERARRLTSQVPLPGDSPVVSCQGAAQHVRVQADAGTEARCAFVARVATAHVVCGAACAGAAACQNTLGL